MSSARRARRRSLNKATSAGPVRDYGPSIRLDGPRTKETEASADPRRLVVKEFRADPDAPGGPLVRGGRVRDPLRRMFETGQIGKWQWDAVEAFRDDLDLAHGARLAADQAAGIRTAPGGRNWPSDMQLDAWRRVAAAMAAFDGARARLLAWTVVHYGTLGSFVRGEAMRNETGSQMLQETLERLADQYRGRNRA